jgi:hypothetical protein
MIMEEKCYCASASCLEGSVEATKLMLGSRCEVLLCKVLLCEVLLCKVLLCEVAGFRRRVVETFAVLGCYAAYVGSWLPTFRSDIIAPYGP